ncbi:MAG TPA: hypothetical protein VFB65_24130 [Pyrinomonadaceae bacterium]|nr:hypothetical protein [Pyrinomonadaceae bacterium]
MNTAEVIEPTRNNNPLAEPLWPPFAAMVAVAGLYAVLPSNLLGGLPHWLLGVIVVGLLVPIMITHHRGNPSLNQRLGYILNTVVTAAMIFSLVLLIVEIAQQKVPPLRLLRSAGVLWLSNILVSASWYWRLDAGGPHQRAKTPGHTDGAFLFPQMTMHPEAKSAAGEEDWHPNFIDYLFLAFNTSTAFSPTDVPVLSRWAKALMMIQALISLLIIALLAGRAVNIIGQTAHS